jgi:hydroxymethylbilane synthase
MTKKNIIIGTRGSKLALYQANKLKDILTDAFSDKTFEIKIIKTKGDKILDVPLSKIGDKGLFTKELEVELLEGKVDLCVHSLKDLPTVFPEGTKLGAVLERADVRDVLISKNNKKLSELKKDAIIGTSSLRRIAQVLKFNPNFVIKDIRGNVDTRLQKLQDQEYDAIIMAAAGIIRMGFAEQITEFIDYETMIPAAGQGAIAVEIRNNDELLQSICDKINHKPTFISVNAERAFLNTMQGGCQVPVGCFTEVEGDLIEITGFVSDIKGTIFFKDSIKVKIEEANEKAVFIAKNLLEKGGQEILDEIYRNHVG